MKLHEAIEACRTGNFVTHNSFFPDQSMHYYNGSLYYEDGANLSSGDFDFSTHLWAQDGWYIKYKSDKVDQFRLRELHNRYAHRMLPSGTSYEDCLLQE